MGMGVLAAKGDGTPIAPAIPQSHTCMCADFVWLIVKYDGFIPIINTTQWTAEHIKIRSFCL